MAAARQAQQQFPHEVAFRIEHRDAAPGRDVLEREVEYGGGLSRARRAEQMEMLSRVGDRQTHRPPPASQGGEPELSFPLRSRRA